MHEERTVDSSLYAPRPNGTDCIFFIVSSPEIELALAAIIRKDFKQASHYVRRSYERFLSKWSNLHPLSEKPRLHELANLQQVRHAGDFRFCKTE